MISGSQNPHDCVGEYLASSVAGFAKAAIDAGVDYASRSDGCAVVYHNESTNTTYLAHTSGEVHEVHGLEAGASRRNAKMDLGRAGVQEVVAMWLDTAEAELAAMRGDTPTDNVRPNTFRSEDLDFVPRGIPRRRPANRPVASAPHAVDDDITAWHGPRLPI